MSLIKNLDCKSDAPAQRWAPVYYACWQWKKLPKQIKATVGPTVQTQPSPPFPNCVEAGWPGEKIDVVLVNPNPDCDYYWSWSNGTGAYLLLTPQGSQPLMAGTPNMPDINAQMSSGNYWEVLDGIDITGSCSYDPVTNETKFNMSGFVLNSNGCKMAFTITYNDV